MKKILVIEDNQDVRENLCEILSLSDYEVASAANGKVGVEMALKNPPDLIICDVMMPELDGYGVLHILGKKPRTADIPFVFLTAKVESNDFRKGMNLGADDYITKPFEHNDLLDVVEIRLKKSERLREANDSSLSQGTFIDEVRGEKALRDLADTQEIRHFKKRDFIFQEGELPRRVYYIRSGMVKTQRTNEGGKEYITQIFRTGDIFGCNAIIQNKHYQESALAMKDTSVALLPKEDFLELMRRNRDFSSYYIKKLSRRIDARETQLLRLAYSSIRKRVAEVLILLDDIFKLEEDKSISILRDDFAGLVGTAKESVIRCLKEFKSESLIEINQGAINILNKDRLEKLPY
ncbi:MAG: response regulator [Bacteroidota bacterium]